eukprot:Opistho-1_new@98981
MPAQYSSEVMSRSSMALNRSDSRRCTICLARASPPGWVRPLAMRRKSWTSVVLKIWVVMVVSSDRGVGTGTGLGERERRVPGSVRGGGLPHPHGIAAFAVATEVLEPVFVQRNSKAWRRWHRQLEVFVLQGLCQDFFGQQQRAEQLGAPLQLAERGKHMGRCHGAHRAFEHGAAVQLDAGGIGNGGHLQGLQQSARLLDLHGEHIGARHTGQGKGRGGPGQGFIGHHGDGVAALEARQRIDRCHGLLHQVATSVHQCGQAVLGIEFAPCHVHIHTHRCAAAHGLLDGGHVGHVIGHAAAADLELEDVVAALREHALGLVDVFGRVAGGQGPGNRQAVAHPAAQQLRDGQTGAVAQGVEQRGLDGALGEAVVLDGLVEPGHDGGHMVGIGADQQRGKVGIHRQLHAFGRLGAVGQAADGGAFAHAHRAIRAVQAHDHQRLAVHGGHRQLVRADRGQVQQQGLDTLDNGRACEGFRAWCLLHGVDWTAQPRNDPTPNRSDSIPCGYSCDFQPIKSTTCRPTICTPMVYPDGYPPAQILRGRGRCAQLHPGVRGAAHCTAAAQPPDPVAGGRTGRAAHPAQQPAAAPHGGGPHVLRAGAADHQPARPAQDRHPADRAEPAAHAVDRFRGVHAVRRAAHAGAQVAPALPGCGHPAGGADLAAAVCGAHVGPHRR